MSSLVEINHIDTGVHFACDRMQASNPTTEATLRFSRCEDRVREIARNPNAAMFFFSAYLDMTDFWVLKRASSVPDDEPFQQEVSRIELYQSLLGPRFFLFAGGYLPRYGKLKERMLQRGFTYNPLSTTLFTYGEYLEICVQTWLERNQRALGLLSANCKVDPELSLSVFQS